MARNIVFLGDCQAESLGQVYDRFVVPATKDRMRKVMADQPKPGDAEAIAQADVVVSQMFDTKKPLTASGMRPDALKVEFPALFIGFLWPFAARRDHVRSETSPLLSDPPYDSQIGDTFLDDLITEGVAADEALRRYLDLDIARVAHLDRIFELHLEILASKDEASGFAFAPVIQAHYRDKHLFLTPGHPNLPLMTLLVRGVFERLGVSPSLIDAAVRWQRTAPMPQSAAPIHPTIIRHFGLRFVNENSTYRFHNEGAFTFSEYVIRYMRHTWNRELAEGITMAESGGDLVGARARLESALQSSPKSVVGWRALSRVLRSLDQLPEACASAAQAIALDPAERDNHIELARALMQQGDLAGAEAATRRALALFFADGAPYLVLVEVLEAQGRAEEAIEAARRAAALRPADSQAHALLGRLLMSGKDLTGAETALCQALKLDPNLLEVKFWLAQVYFLRQDNREALRLATELLEVVTNNPHIYGLLGHVQAARGELDEAEAAFHTAVGLDPNVSGFRDALSSIRAHRQAMHSAQAAD